MLRDSGALNGLLLAAVVLCALSVVTSQHKARKLFNELQKEKERAQLMDVEWGQLQLEQSTLATSARIEKIASKQLQMQLPKNSQIRFIRVEQSSPQTSGESEAKDDGEMNHKGADRQP
jgi:cell division protein FtsL